MSLKIGTVTSLVALALGSSLAYAAPKALDGEIEIVDPAEDAYVQDGGIAVRTGLGECLRLSGWSEDDSVDACEGREPEPEVEVVEVVEPEPAPVPEPEPMEPIITTATLGAEALFNFDEAALTPASEQALADLLVQLERFQEISAIEVVGHTDSRGAEEYNQGLSERRAQSVRDFLAAAYPDVEIMSRGLGETAPVATNSSPEGRQLNRRVEVQVTAKSITEPDA